MDMRNVKFSTRLALGFACLVALVAFMAAFGLYSVRNINIAIGSIYADRVVPLKQLKIVSDMYAVSIVDGANKVAAGMYEPKAALAQVDQATGAIAEEWKAYMATKLTVQEAQDAASVAELMGKAAPVVASLRAALESGDKDKVTALIRPIYETVDPLTGAVGKLVDLQLTEARGEYDRSTADYQKTIALFSVIVVVAISIGSAIGLLLIRAISRPLNQAVDVAREVAGGNLTQHIEAKGKSETGLLLSALRDMQDSLVAVVATVHQGSEGVASASASA